ncbi:MAG: hypothetical protein R2882_04570 [Gemmatimonadales bacterium]
MALSLIAAPFLLKSDALAQTKKVTQWERGCAGGRAADCHDLAKAYRQGKERVVPDPAKAADFYRRACELDRPEACQEFGEALVAGVDGFEPDTALALTVLRRACWTDPEGRGGRIAGLIGGRRRCEPLVDLYGATSPGDRADSVDRKQATIRACNRGSVDAACDLLAGGMLQAPDSLPLDDTVKTRLAAEEAARLAAEQARADSIRADSIARVRQQEADSIAAARAAAAAAARRNRPRGPTPQTIARRTSFKRSCEADVAEACLNYAAMLERGEGGPVDRPGAVAARRKGCQLKPNLPGCTGET